MANLLYWAVCMDMFVCLTDYSKVQHHESYTIWSAIIRINTEGKSLIMQLGLTYILTLTITSIFQNSSRGGNYRYVY